MKQLFQPGHRKLGGKKKGTPNKKTRELREFLQDVRKSETYQDGLRRRLESGRAPHVESLMVRDELGDPTQEHKVTGKVIIEWQR